MQIFRCVGLCYEYCSTATLNSVSTWMVDRGRGLSQPKNHYRMGPFNYYVTLFLANFDLLVTKCLAPT